MKTHKIYQKMSVRAGQALAVVRALGVGWALERVHNTLVTQSGWLKHKTPTRPWSAFEVWGCALWNGQTPFFFPLGTPPHLSVEQDVQSVLHAADEVCEGHLLVHAHKRAPYGNPPRWLHNPTTDRLWSTQQHWTKTPTFDPTHGDIKEVWSASRFTWVFELVRGFSRTQNARYAQTFWHFLDTWCEANPPQMGPNWKCGQETALRAMAALFGAAAFGRCEAATDARRARLVGLLHASAVRIEAHIDYALSQKNNHGISEAAGLLSIGLILPELPGSARWVALGKRLVEREVARQVYEDGSYVQHSMNYHRVLLHLGVWIERLTRLHNTPMSTVFYEKMALAARFLRLMSDRSGATPNYGGNDGALLFPLSGEAYWDYRPTVQTASRCFEGLQALEAGPWDETGLWLLGPQQETKKTADLPTACAFLDGGYATLRAQDEGAWCMMRGHTYRDRPSHVDMLHLDLWWRGQNIFPDGGTFRYFDPDHPEIADALKDLRGHNSVELNGQGPLQMASRFLWVPWPKGRISMAGFGVMEGVHEAYKGVLHRRRVEQTPDGWRVKDFLEGDGFRQVAVRWRLHPQGHWDGRRARFTVGDVRVSFGVIGHAEGWEARTEKGFYSLYYGAVEEVEVLVYGGIGRLPLEITTDFVLEGAQTQA